MMSRYGCLSIEEAADQIVANVTVIQDVEYVDLLDAQGRILAEDMIAEINNPPFDRSPCDGYACRAEDLVGATKENPCYLKVLEEIDAGGYSERVVSSGEAVRIMTGAAIPAGCNCCVYQENTDYGEDTVAVYHPVDPWTNYCNAGEDFKKGDLMLRAGQKIGYVEQAVIASLGKATVPVYRRPRITLLTSGDEVVDPGRPLAPGKIYNSNLTLLTGRLKSLGIEASYTESVEDEPSVMAARIREIAPHVDLIITTGGVSVGKKDIMHEAMEILGAARVFWGVGVKPGMPSLFTVYNSCPVISLSGNPFGVAVTEEVLVRPALHKMTSDPDLALRRVRGVLMDIFPKKLKGRRMIRALYEDGKFYLPGGLRTDGVTHTNGVLSSMAGCNCLLDVKSGSVGRQLDAGMEVEAILL